MKTSAEKREYIGFQISGAVIWICLAWIGVEYVQRYEECAGGPPILSIAVIAFCAREAYREFLDAKKRWGF